MKMPLPLLLTLITLLAAPVYAQTSPQFAFPLDCTLGTNCWIANYVDTDPAPDSHKDFKCGGKTYENHKGTDFALRNYAEMEEGVDVLAAKAGTVLRLRDGESDKPKTRAELENISTANKDCGNGIVLDHGNGLLTYYCHLKNGSIIVTPGQKIEEGQKIAQIGQSGYAEFPHLHLTLIWEGSHIDPFTGLAKEDGCGNFKDSLWKDDLAYAPYAIFDGGFSSRVPDFKTIEAGTPDQNRPSPAGEAFVFWVSFYQVEKDSEITLTIKDPKGGIFAHTATTQDKHRARQHYYTGRKLNEHTRLIPGTYTGIATIKYAGEAPQSAEYKIEIK
jgi:hypothetical protein